MKHQVNLLRELLVCSELTVKDYKEILKCTYGDSPDKKTFVTSICEILSNTTDKSPDFFLNSSIIDIFLLLLKLKINSHGESCNVVINKNDKKMNLELKFEHMFNDVKKWFEPHLNKNITFETIVVTFDCPSLKLLLEHEEDEILYFIKGCKILKKHDKLLEPSNIKECKMLFESLPPKLASEIYNHYNNFAKEISQKNLLEHYPSIKDDHKLMFSPSIDSLLWFTKLMFNEPLDSFYDNLFYLTNLGHFSTEYIENCTPGEYIYFTKKLEQSLSNQQKTEVSSDEQILDEE